MFVFDGRRKPTAKPRSFWACLLVAESPEAKQSDKPVLDLDSRDTDACHFSNHAGGETMSHPGRIVIILCCLSSATAGADFTISHNVNIEATGILSMMATEGTVTRRISGQKSHTEGLFESKSGFVPGSAQGMNSAEIIRLDRRLTWQLRPEQQQYTELTLEQARQQMMERVDAVQQASQSNQGGLGLPISTENCQWSPAQVSVDKTGESERIAGQKSEQSILRISQSCTDPQSGSSCEVAWVLDTWLASRVRGNEEAMAFDRAYAKEMGMDQFLPGAEAGGMAQPLLSMFSEGLEEAADKLAELKGYPMRTNLQVEMGGDSCMTQNGQQIAMDDIWGEAGMAGMEAGGYQASAQLGQVVGQEVSESMGSGVGGSIAGSAAGAATSSALSGLFGKFSKKKREEKAAEEKKRAEEAAAAKAQQNANTNVVLFRINQEVSFVSGDRVPAEKFEVPAGWTRVAQ